MVRMPSVCVLQAPGRVSGGSGLRQRFGNTAEAELPLLTRDAVYNGKSKVFKYTLNITS